MPDVARVLDASAVLAVVQGEAGAEQVLERLDGAAIGAVNLSEALLVLLRKGVPEAVAESALANLQLQVYGFAAEAALPAARLHQRCPWLSFGDRACLALAEALGVPAVTADRSWRNVPKALRVELIR